ncbi:EAL domain-containing protein [Deinococcus deserti]|uniref:Putative signal transduction protein: sensor, PAS/PAC domains regulator, GGDEF/EAL domains n=1 Tax=Deinococcus deserti (strain DSM 17065 / CIP 109153 / LMG 22923 / VCD115) TaxID=546414 RepID=C1D0E7_DEIDV|nr:EAL domain-containing protein [Deinococcus deserti]ACO45321.1 putative signal transduction protein: sensor, PAS/PAC domains; regulator, GGDEF/EAL domains [Deinococcus deserti VCD115]
MTPVNTNPALHTALRDVLRLHSPLSTLMAPVGGEVLCVTAENVRSRPGADLVPPDAWLDRGEMTWLTRDGTLLGLLWSEAGSVPPDAEQVLTLLLSAARQDGPNHETDVLITQLPVPALWLSSDLRIRQVSRPFLEWFRTTDAAVVGRAVSEVVPGQPDLIRALEQAAAGRATRLPDAVFQLPDGPRPVRGETRPFFAAGQAGVMALWQDTSSEHAQALQIQALLDTDTPTALLKEDGAVLQASTGLLELAPPTAAAVPGAPLWAWPCFADVPSEAVRQLVSVASGGGAAQADVSLALGGTLALSVRRTSVPGLLIASSAPPGVHAAGAPAGLVAQMLSHLEDAAVALDHGGRVQFVSDPAATLLGVDAARLLGLGFGRVLADLGVHAFTPQGEPLPLPDWREQHKNFEKEIQLALPSGTVRTMQIRGSVLALEGTQSGKPGLLLSARDVTALRHAQAKMRHDARHDALTGLLNRAGLREVLTRPPTGPEAVACLGVEDFAALTAALGRTAFDHLLIQLAARLNDLAAAYGGEAARLADTVFAVQLPGMAAPEATQRLRTMLATPLRAGRRDVPLGCALGVTDQVNADRLADAEIAMQHARQQGRAQVSVFHPGMRAEVARTFELEDALGQALGGEQFTLLYQPAVRLSDGRPLGAEALLRWNHPSLGVLSPGAFLPVASRMDLLTQVSEWVVTAALQGRREVRAARPGAFADWQVSVNLSLAELRGSAGLGRLLPTLRAEGAPDIEVTAGSLLDHSQDTLGLLEQLRSLGAQLSVDDFGDSSTNLAALTRFPLSAVKLHPTLTARVPEDARSVTLVEGTVDLAHRLGLSVTAVGVETPEQLAMLRDLGCDAAQGFAIAPPLSTPDLLTWLQSHDM